MLVAITGETGVDILESEILLHNRHSGNKVYYEYIGFKQVEYSYGREYIKVID